MLKGPRASRPLGPLRGVLECKIYLLFCILLKKGLKIWYFFPIMKHFKKALAACFILSSFGAFAAGGSVENSCSKAFDQSSVFQDVDPAHKLNFLIEKMGHKKVFKKDAKEEIKNLVLEFALNNQLSKVKTLLETFPFLKKKQVRFNFTLIDEAISEMKNKGSSPIRLQPNQIAYHMKIFNENPRNKAGAARGEPIPLAEHLQNYQLQILEKQKNWASPAGWGLTQIAAYVKNYKLLKLLMDSGVDIRTLKTTGGVSIESNALHIFIKQGDIEGVRLMTSHLAATKDFSKKKGYFIDEKDEIKRTALFLAVRLQDYNNPRILRKVIRMKPSASVEIPVRIEGVWYIISGWELIHLIKDPKLNDLAWHDVWFPLGYHNHFDIRRRRPKSRPQPPSGMKPRHIYWKDTPVFDWDDIPFFGRKQY